jgi:hypothetical protein
MQFGKSNGKDEHYIEFLKLAKSDLLEDCVFHMINNNLLTGSTAPGMRDAIICFLFKKGVITECTNYRTLSLLSCIG